MTPEQPNPNTESERVPNEPQAIPRPETYVLERPDSAIVWQATRLSNGSLHLAFSADERLHADCVTHMRQFENNEIVFTPQGTLFIEQAHLGNYEIGKRTFHHVVYTIIKRRPIRDEETGALIIDEKTGEALLEKTYLEYSELDLLDYDNPRDWRNNALYNSYMINQFYDNWHHVTRQNIYLDKPNREDK